MKRFQEANKLVKIWRYRWYLLAIIQWIWYSTISKFKVYDDDIEDGELFHTDRYEVQKGKELWKLLISLAQYNMKWYHTHEEILNEINSW